MDLNMTIIVNLTKLDEIILNINSKCKYYNIQNNQH